MSSPIDFSAQISRAKQAVQDVEDPFKIPAFTVVLTKLLNDSHSLGTPSNTNDFPIQKHKPEMKVSANNEAKPGPKLWITELANEGFFKEPKNTRHILEALNERGHILTSPDITDPLASLVVKQVLRRKKMKPDGENRIAVHWVNW